MSVNVVDNVVGAQALRGVTKPLPEHDDDVRNFIPLEVIQPDLRQSNIGTFFKCHRMYLFKERMGLVPGGYAPAATIGTLFHLAHNARTAGLDEAGVSNVVGQAVSDIQNSLVGWAEETGQADKAARFQEDAERDAAQARVMSYLHSLKYPLFSDPCWVCGQKGCRGLEVVSVEKDYSTKIEDIPKPGGGRIDMLLKHTGNGIDGLILVDHKTIGWSLKQWIESKAFATQPRLYRVLVMSQEEFKGQRIIGFLYNLVRRPSCKWKAWQSFEDYIRECRDWYDGKDDSIGEPKKSTGKKGGYILDDDGNPKMYPRWEWSKNSTEWEADPPMRRVLQLFDEEPITPEFENKLRIVSKASSAAPRLSNFPTTGEDSASCRFYNKRCPYMDFCGSDPSEWHGIMERGWTTRDAAPESSDLEDYL